MVSERIIKEHMWDELRERPNSTITELVESMCIYFDLDEELDGNLMMWAADVIDEFQEDW